MDIETIAEKIESKEDFDLFLKALFEDYSKNLEEWENKNLKDFLGALFRCSKSIEGYYENWNIEYDFEKPTWKMLSDIILGAKVY